MQTHHSLWPAHTLAEEQQLFVWLNKTLEFRSVRCAMDVAAVIFVPLFQIFRSQKCVIQPGHSRIRFARVECLVVTDEIVHLCGRNQNRHQLVV